MFNSSLVTRIPLVFSSDDVVFSRLRDDRNFRFDSTEWLERERVKRRKIWEIGNIERVEETIEIRIAFVYIIYIISKRTYFLYLK